MSEKAKSIDAYIEGFADNIQSRLRLIRDTIRKAAPGCEETMRYGMPAFKINNEHIYFSAYKNHIGMYPMYGMPHLEKELEIYRGKNTKDAIHFSHSKELPIDLIEKIVKTKLKGW